MQRLLTHISLPGHLLLILVIVILRFPAFDQDYYLPDESLALLCAQKLNETGGDLYTDAWYAGPPLSILFYRIFYFVFGDFALQAIRIFACFYVYLIVLVFNNLLQRYKYMERMKVLPPLILAVLLSIPWYSVEANRSLLALLPILISYYSVLRLGKYTRTNYRLMFGAGALMMIAILTTHKAAVMLLGICFVYLILYSPRIDELFALFGGLVVSLMGFLLLFHLQGNLTTYWDNGFLYFLDSLILPRNELYGSNYARVMVNILWHWGGFIVLFFIGFLHFRAKFFSYLAKIRSLERLMRLWLIFAVITLGLKAQRLALQDFILIAPSLAFYASKALSLPGVYRFRLLILPLLLLVPLFTYSQYLNLVQVDKWAWAQRIPGIQWLQQNPTQNTPEQARIYSEMSQRNYQSIWIMDHWPDFYLRLGATCSNKYTDYRMAYDKLTVLHNQEESPILSRWENERRFFEEWQKNLTEAVVDPKGNFVHFQKRFPGLLSDYYPDPVLGTQLYIRKKTSPTAQSTDPSPNP